MALRDAAQRVVVKPVGEQCSIARIVARLDADDRAWLTEALADEDATGEWIARVLTAEGHQIKGQTVNRHRRGICACET